MPTANCLRICLALVSLLVLPSGAVAAVVIVAHRGGQAETPENTLPAIANSIAVGADWVEVDVRKTSDGVLVLMHDTTVDRTTNGTGAVSDLSSTEVLALDAGSWFDPEFAGTPVPALSEAMALALDSAPLLLDLKDSTAVPEIASLLAQLNRSPNEVKIWATSATEINDAKIYLPGADILFQAFGVNSDLLVFLAAEGTRGVSIRWAELTQDMIDQSHALGLEVYLFATSNLSNFEVAIEMGIDGIHASDPSSVTQLVASLPCVDGIDNDADGRIDYDEDLGCESRTAPSELPQCIDGIDNDNDGATDYPADTSCSWQHALSESTQCSNGLDDDGDGDIDYGADAQCSSPADKSEASAPFCGLLGIEPLAVWLLLGRRRKARHAARAAR